MIEFSFNALENYWALEVFLLALAIDLFLGEPPVKVHPVVLIGKLITHLQKVAKPNRFNGILAVLLVVSTTTIVGHLLIISSSKITILGPVLSLLVSAYLLKSTIAIKSLLQTSAQIGRLIKEDLEAAKKMLPALISRNPNQLSRSQASSAVIESLSENYVDTIVSPIFYYVLFSPMGLGVEGALAYKAVNTLDSMLGYKTRDLVEFGWASAKLDDLTNWIPARLSFIIMAAAHPQKARKILGAALKDHAQAPSPNSGWPMAGAAGALGVRLEKPGIYVIQKEGDDPTPENISLALKLVATTIVLNTIIASLLLI